MVVVHVPRVTLTTLPPLLLFNLRSGPCSLCNQFYGRTTIQAGAKAHRPQRRHPETTAPHSCSVTSPYPPRTRLTPHRIFRPNRRNLAHDGSEQLPRVSPDGGSTVPEDCGSRNNSDKPTKCSTHNSKTIPTAQPQGADIHSLSTG